MASIVDMCWTRTEELFEDVDLDSLYVNQARRLAVDNNEHYPYIILLHTGKITIAVNLSKAHQSPEWQCGAARDPAVSEDSLFFLESGDGDV
ncbi:MAG: hypothetical protein FJ118_02145 [Deltaproteobacteria bacterium]|nr:hypothetical protein [Deltaproteobacteria bacterium]